MKIRWPPPPLPLFSEGLWTMKSPHSQFPALFSVVVVVVDHVSLVPLMLAAPAPAAHSACLPALLFLLLLHRRRGGAVLLREQWRPIKETIMHCIGGPN